MPIVGIFFFFFFWLVRLVDQWAPLSPAWAESQEGTLTHQRDDLHEAPKGEEDGEQHLGSNVLLYSPSLSQCDFVEEIIGCARATTGLVWSGLLRLLTTDGEEKE